MSIGVFNRWEYIQHGLAKSWKGWEKVGFALLYSSHKSLFKKKKAKCQKKKYKKYISFAYSSCLGCQSKYKHINHITSFSYSHSAKSS